MTAQNERMQALIEAARHEARVEQLREQLNDKSSQMDSWVRRSFALESSKLRYDLSDAEGSII